MVGALRLFKPKPDVEPGDVVFYAHKGATFHGEVVKVQRRTLSVRMVGRVKDHANVPFSAVLSICQRKGRGPQARRTA